LELAHALKKIGGLAPPVSAFDETALPAHLRMNFALVDENNAVIARSRDLGQLKARYGTEAGRNFQDIAHQGLAFSGRRAWDFGDLPCRYEGEVDGQALCGFPAIVDEGETVGVRVFDLPETARIYHEFGLIRLFRLALTKELKYLRKNLPLNPNLEILHRQLPALAWSFLADKKSQELREDLLDRVVAVVFLEGRPGLRAQSEFAKRLEEGRTDLVGKASEVSGLITRIFDLYAEVRSTLKPAPDGPMLRDVGEQLGRLIYSGFVAVTPYQHLLNIPRYLKAVQCRLEKFRQDPTRDRRQQNELMPYWSSYWESVASLKDSLPPERDEFRWALEEFRVSLFAQHLKTAYPISAKRLRDWWSKRELGGRERKF
jgi:ATP-dependent helicase HrpA